MLETVKLMIGTNLLYGDKLLKKGFNPISWWSDNLETVAHYYEGRVIEITIKLDSEKVMKYVREISDVDRLNIELDDYTYGTIHTRCPEGATWYSFGREYLKENIIDIKEIFPDLSEFNEE